MNKTKIHMASNKASMAHTEARYASLASSEASADLAKAAKAWDEALGAADSDPYGAKVTRAQFESQVAVTSARDAVKKAAAVLKAAIAAERAGR